MIWFIESLQIATSYIVTISISFRLLARQSAYYINQARLLVWRVIRGG